MSTSSESGPVPRDGRHRQGGEREAPKPTGDPEQRQGGANENHETAGEKAGSTIPRERRRPKRQPNWNSAGLLILAAIGFFWWTGTRVMNRPGEDHSRPVTKALRRSQTVLNNNASARRNLVVDLDGTSIVYPDEVKALAVPDGRFRTGLTLKELADVLKIDIRTIAPGDSVTEVNRDAVLFTAFTGRLTDSAKARSRSERQMQAERGLRGDFAADEWIIEEVPFTLNALDHPSDKQKAILRAIWRSAREDMPEPGEKFRAVGVSRLEIQSGDVDFSPGYLPLESLVASARATGP